MRVQRKLTILLFLVIALLVSMLLWQMRIGRSKLVTFVSNEYANQEYIFDKIVAMQGEPLAVFANDYTYWDEMVTFVATKNEVWAAQNIAASLDTYNADAAWAYNLDPALIYFTTRLDDNPFEEVSIVLSDKVIGKAFKEDGLCHFYINTARGILEIRGATIHPTADSERKTPPNGYFFVGRLWSKEKLDYFSNILKGAISIVPLNGVQATGAEKEKFDTNVINFTRTLLGWDRKPVATIHVHIPVPIVRNLSEGFSQTLVLQILFLGIVLIVALVLLTRWVSVPLHKISDALITENTALIQDMQAKKDEFANIAQMIVSFFKQKARLIDDIERRKKAEEARSYSEEKYRLLFESSQDAILTFSFPDWRFASGNPAAVMMFKVENEAGLIAKDVCDFSPQYQPDGQASDKKARAMIEKALQEGVNSFEWVYRRSTGEEFPSVVTLVRFTWKGQVVLQAAIRDVTENKKIEIALKKNEAMFRGIAFAAPIGLAISANRVVQWVNEQFLQLIGLSREEVVDYDSRILYESNEEYRRIAEKLYTELEKHGHAAIETVWRHKNGSTLNIMLTGEVLSRGDLSQGVVFAAVDITERKKAEEKLKQAVVDELKSRELMISMLDDNNQARAELQKRLDELKQAQRMLIQSEKLASIGQLSAGIAHEINNPLGFINSNIATLDKYIDTLSEILRAQEILKAAVEQNNLEKAKKVSEDLRVLEKKLDLNYILTDIDALIRESKDGVERIRRIVLDLKTFSRRDQDERVPANINKVIEGVVNIVWNEIKYKAELHKEYGTVPDIDCNPQQIGQVFINLLVNAAQAIKDKGSIFIRTYTIGEKIAVEVEDTGYGMDQETMGKIFDPFFTTKEVGKGTGLGLSVSYEIVKKHNGDIEVKSQPGKGTTFIVWLPTGAQKRATI